MVGICNCCNFLLVKIYHCQRHNHTPPFKQKMDKQRKTAVKVPKLKILWNKREIKKRNELGLSFYSMSGDEDIEAPYPDLGSVNDSKEGVPEELEEVREGAGEGGHASILGETPLPKHLGNVSGNLCSVAFKLGPTCQYQV